MTCDEQSNATLQQTANGDPAHPSDGTANGGPPSGNTNAIRHGLTASALPKGCRRIERMAGKLRHSIEAAVLDSGGTLDLVTVATVNTAVRWATHGMLAARWLRLHCDEMDNTERLTFSREVARASAERDKSIRLLGLGRATTPTIAETLEAVHRENALQAARVAKQPEPNGSPAP
jgi:hypothetical protein